MELTPQNAAAHLKLAQAFRATGKPELAKQHERDYEQLQEQNQALHDARDR